jgi:hypothetical protein
MSIFKPFNERRDPGPVGKINVNPPEQNEGDPPKKWLIFLVVVLGLFLITVALYWVVNSRPHQGIGGVLINLCFLAAYLLTAHFIRPVPDNTNMGLLGGLVDNPFRFSDNYNRYLAMLKGILFPGRIMTYSLIMTSWLLNKLILKLLNR